MNTKIVFASIVLLLVGTVSGTTTFQNGGVSLTDDGQLRFGNLGPAIEYDSSINQFEIVNRSSSNPMLQAGNGQGLNLFTNTLNLNSNNIIDAGLVGGVDVSDHSARHESDGVDELNVSGLSGVLSDSQPVQVHGNDKHLENYTTTDAFIEDFSTSGPQGYIPVSQGNGDIQMEDNTSLGTTEDVRIISSSYTTQGESTLIIDSGITSVTLSTEDVNDRAHLIRVKDATGNAGSNTVTINTEGSALIDGQSSVTLNNDYESLQFQSDGSNWFIVGNDY